MDINLPDTKNATWKNDKTRFGYKFLSKFGWSDEKGLGKDETGMTSSVAVTKREESLGIGAEKMTDGGGAKGWSETTTGFNSILEKLNSEYGKKSKKDKKEKKKSKKSDSSSDDDGERKKKSKKEKKEKKNSSKSEPPVVISVGIK
jgi:Pin2-interacting protein X1